MKDKMEAMKKEIEGKEKKKKEFLKRQQKHYCRIVWTGLADENKNQLEKQEEKQKSNITK